MRGGRVVQRQVCYLGEINDSQRAAWCRTIEVLQGKSGSRQMALFPLLRFPRFEQSVEPNRCLMHPARSASTPTAPISSLATCTGVFARLRAPLTRWNTRPDTVGCLASGTWSTAGRTRQRRSNALERRFAAVVLGNHDRPVLSWFAAKRRPLPPAGSEWLRGAPSEFGRWRAAAYRSRSQSTRRTNPSARQAPPVAINSLPLRSHTYPFSRSVS